MNLWINKTLKKYLVSMWRVIGHVNVVHAVYMMKLLADSDSNTNTIARFVYVKLQTTTKENKSPCMHSSDDAKVLPTG